MAHMRAAKWQEQSPAHGVPDVPRATQGWRGRGPAQERHGAAHAPELTRGATSSRFWAIVRRRVRLCELEQSQTGGVRVCAWRIEHVFVPRSLLNSFINQLHESYSCDRDNIMTTVQTSPLGCSGYHPGLVPGMRKCRMSRHSGCFFNRGC